MFDNLSQRLQSTIKKLKGESKISESNIGDALREVRMALLEADVALPVVKNLVERIKNGAIGQEVGLKLTPDQAFLKIVRDELTAIMGTANDQLNLRCQPPAVILLAGLQGSGKTTTTAKLALRLAKEKKKVAVVSTDVYRPAAIQQLETLAQQVGVSHIPSRADEPVLAIAQRALDFAQRQYFDVLLVDTAGRLHVDAELMEEIKSLHEALHPIETLFVVDAMTGQDAANTAKAFDEALPLTGVILSKIDGDARGGAALSIREITGKPIKFFGVGEKVEALEPFHPDRIANRILGMGDVFGLIEDLEAQMANDQTQQMVKKMVKGQGFNLEDFREQLQQLQQMDMGKFLAKIPGLGAIPQQLKDEQLSRQRLRRQEAIILSMTPEERRHPELIKASRKRRIAQGCGQPVAEVNKLLKQFQEMQTQMKKFKGGKLAKMMGMMPPFGKF